MKFKSNREILFFFFSRHAFQILESKLIKDVYEEKEKTESDSDGKFKDNSYFIQDVGFSIKIISPGAEAFDIQVRTP